MKILVQLLGAVLALLLSQAQAAELRVPEAFDVLMVNGKEFGASLRSTKNVALQPGRNIIVLEYDQIFDAEFGDSHDRIRSAPFALQLDVTADTVLSITPPKLSTGADARRYAESPTLQILDQQRREVGAQTLPVREINGMLLADTGTSPVAAQPALPATTATSTSSAANRPTSAPIAAPDALQMLSYWWQQATPEQRAAFLQQITR